MKIKGIGIKPITKTLKYTKGKRTKEDITERINKFADWFRSIDRLSKRGHRGKKG
jgi:hypothetical protein